MKCSHAIRKFRALKRNIPFNSLKRCRIAMYIACVMSVRLFNSMIWSPFVVARRKMEKKPTWSSVLDHMRQTLSLSPYITDSPTDLLSNNFSRSQTVLKITAQPVQF